MGKKKDDFMDKVRRLEKLYVLTIVRINDAGNQEYWFGRLDQSDELRPLKFEASNGSVAWKKLLDHVEANEGLPSAD